MYIHKGKGMSCGRGLGGACDNIKVFSSHPIPTSKLLKACKADMPYVCLGTLQYVDTVDIVVHIVSTVTYTRCLCIVILVETLTTEYLQ